MKLKSKLIATIVSMCAAIAVMGVGVWASTSQNFTVTVKNDVDVKIVNVNADVYGEFAVYSQFSGSNGTANVTPGYATRITGGADSVKEGYKNHSEYDHGYLLYAIGIGGYNDGVSGAFENKTDYTANDDATWGYGKFINEAKNNMFLATEKGTLVNSNTTSTTLSIRDTGSTPFTNSYNVDSTTHIAQVAYMYTINQWESGGTDNAIYGKVNAALTQSTIDKIKATLKEGSGYNSLIIPNLYVGKKTTAGTAWQALTLDASGNAYFELPSTKGKTGDKGQTEDNGGVYRVLLTFTFARNSANLDLQELQDALQHSLTLVTVDEKDAKATYTAIDGNGTALVYSATSGTLSNTNVYSVEGSAYSPDTTTIGTQITGAYNQTKLQNVFALKDNDNTTSFLPTGFIYLAESNTNTTLGTGYTWIRDLYQNGRTTSTPYGVAVDAS